MAILKRELDLVDALGDMVRYFCLPIVVEADWQHRKSPKNSSKPQHRKTRLAIL